MEKAWDDGKSLRLFDTEKKKQMDTGVTVHCQALDRGDLKVHAPSYRIPEPCTGENRDQRDYDNAADGADHRRPGQPQRKEKIPADKQLDTGAQQRSFREKIKRFH